MIWFYKISFSAILLPLINKYVRDLLCFVHLYSLKKSFKHYTMYKKILFLACCVLTLAACNYERGSGNIIKQERVVGNFSSLKVTNKIDVVVTIGSPQTIVVEADDNLIEFIETNVNNEELEITLKSGINVNPVRKIYITTPTLSSLSASSSASILVKGIISGNEEIKLAASSSGSIKTALQAPRVNAKASSSGVIEISGKTKSFEAQSSSSGEVAAENLLSENTDVKASSSGSCVVHASVSLNAKASSSGSIEYKGNPQLKVEESSSGKVRAVN